MRQILIEQRQGDNRPLAHCHHIDGGSIENADEGFGGIDRIDTLGVRTPEPEGIAIPGFCFGRDGISRPIGGIEPRIRVISQIPQMVDGGYWEALKRGRVDAGGIVRAGVRLVGF